MTVYDRNRDKFLDTEVRLNEVKDEVEPSEFDLLMMQNHLGFNKYRSSSEIKREAEIRVSQFSRIQTTILLGLEQRLGLLPKLKEILSLKMRDLIDVSYEDTNEVGDAIYDLNFRIREQAAESLFTNLPETELEELAKECPPQPYMDIEDYRSNLVVRLIECLGKEFVEEK